MQAVHRTGAQSCEERESNSCSNKDQKVCTWKMKRVLFKMLFMFVETFQNTWIDLAKTQQFLKNDCYSYWDLIYIIKGILRVLEPNWMWFIEKFNMKKKICSTHIKYKSKVVLYSVLKHFWFCFAMFDSYFRWIDLQFWEKEKYWFYSGKNSSNFPWTYYSEWTIQIEKAFSSTNGRSFFAFHYSNQMLNSEWMV